MKFVPKGPINNIAALVQIMAWHPPGDKPLSEQMMVSLTTHICVTRPQWVKWFMISQPNSSRIRPQMLTTQINSDRTFIAPRCETFDDLFNADISMYRSSLIPHSIMFFLTHTETTQAHVCISNTMYTENAISTLIITRRYTNITRNKEFNNLTAWCRGCPNTLIILSVLSNTVISYHWFMLMLWKLLYHVYTLLTLRRLARGFAAYLHLSKKLRVCWGREKTIHTLGPFDPSMYK